MQSPILVIGHKNPDNDAICAAVGYACLKNELARREAGEEEPAFKYVPARLGPLPPETAHVLADNGVEAPLVVNNLYARVSDVMTHDPICIGHDATLLEAGRKLRSRNVRALVVTNEDGSYRGLISTRMIAERYISATDLLETGSSTMAVASDLISSLDQKVEDASKDLQCIKTTLLASMQGYNPTTAIEFGRKVLFSTGDYPRHA